MDEFVVCPSCGTRIKAGREFCLRCFGPLPTPERPIKPPIWVSLGLSDSKKQAVAGAVAALVIGFAVVIYLTEPPAVDEIARPAVNQPPPRKTAQAEVAPAAASPPAGTDSAPGTGAFQPSPAVSDRAAVTATDVAALESKRSTLEAELAKSPEDVGLLNDIGVALDQLGRASDAIPKFERALALAPDRPRLHSNLAHALSAVGLWDRAVAEYREAARLKPDDYLAQFNLAQTLQRKGDDQGAVVEFQKAVKIKPNESSGQLLLGVSLETSGRRAEALKAYRRFLALEPTSTDSDRLRSHLEMLGEEGKP